MKLLFVYIITLNLFVVTKAQAIAFCGWSDTLSCTGNGLCCNEANSVCCSTPGGFGFSWNWNPLPSGTQGQVYIDGDCADFLDVRFGPGDQCWSGGGTRAPTANWFHSLRDDTVATNNTECAVANVLTYTDDTGDRKVIQLPGTKEEVEKAVSLLNAKEWASLAKYPAAANLN